MGPERPNRYPKSEDTGERMSLEGISLSQPQFQGATPIQPSTGAGDGATYTEICWRSKPNAGALRSTQTAPPRRSAGLLSLKIGDQDVAPESLRMNASQ